jgi:hypothetical protein
MNGDVEEVVLEMYFPRIRESSGMQDLVWPSR